MSLQWSASTGGFYDTEINRKVPRDAVTITVAQRAALLDAQACGARIEACPDTGMPRAVAPVIDRRAALRQAIGREAARRIDTVSPPWRQLNDLRERSEAGSARFAAIDAIRAACGLICDTLDAAGDDALDAFPVRDNPLWPSVGEAA